MRNSCRFIRDDAAEAEAVRKADAEAEAERKRVAASVRGSLTKQVGKSVLIGHSMPFQCCTACFHSYPKRFTEHRLQVVLLKHSL